MPEEFYQLSQLNIEFIKHLRLRTITAIIVISITYVIAITLLVAALITSQTNYGFFAVLIPLLVYIWLITYGGKKHVNNHYSFKHTSEGILLFKNSGKTM